tara:strand:- start:1421 stop:1945 length:525 start_codon:yes stop_codon:yes gene_type:complete
MTVIAGYRTEGVTCIAADSSASDDASIESRLEPKVWEQGEWTVASCPSFRLMQVLKYEISFDSILGSPDETCMKELVRKLVPLLKLRLDADASVGTDWCIMFGGMGNLWIMDADYAINEVETYASLGSGADYAMGAMSVMDEDDYLIADIAFKAAEAACSHSQSCCGPINLLLS